MAFQQQRNIFSGLAQGVAQAGQALAGFFTQRAQQQRDLGVAAISRAQADLKALDELRRDPDLAATPEQALTLNARRSMLEQIINAPPLEAIKLSQELAASDATSGVNVKDIVAGVQSTRGGEALAPRGVQSGVPGETNEAPAGVETTQAQRVITPMSFNQMFSDLQRGAAQGERAYNERLAADEREFLLLRDDKGFQHEVRLSEMNNLARLDQARMELEAASEQQKAAAGYDAELLEAKAGYDAELARLASQLGMSEQAVMAAYTLNRDRVLAGLAEDAAVADSERELQFASLEEARATAADLYATVKDVAASPAQRKAAAATLGRLRDGGQLGVFGDMYSEDILSSSLQMVDPLVRQAREVELNEIIASEGSTQLAKDRAQAELDLLNENITIAGQQVDMNRLLMDSQETVNARAEFDLNHLQTTSAHEFVENAVVLGRPEYLRDLLAEATNPGSHPELAHLASQVSPKALQSAIAAAEQVDSDAQRSRDLALAEIERQFRATDLGTTADRMTFIGEVGLSGLSPDDILGDVTLQTMVRQGKITQGDLRAMANQARLRQVLEAQQVNAPAITRATDRLMNEYSTKMPKTEGEYMAAEAGLRSTLEELVSLKAMNQDDVEGLVALYTAAWRNGNKAIDLEFANSAASTALLRAQANDYAAKAAGTGPYATVNSDGIPLPDAATMNAYVNIMEEKRSGIAAMYPHCAAPPNVGEVEAAQASARSLDCGEYDRLMSEWRTENDMMMSQLGVPVSPSVLDRQAGAVFVQNVLDEYGEDALNAFTLSAYAQDNGFDVPEFRLGSDPIVWLNENGYSEEELIARAPDPNETAAMRALNNRFEQAKTHPEWEGFVNSWLANPRTNLGIWDDGVNGVFLADWADKFNLPLPELRKFLRDLVRDGEQPVQNPDALPGPVYSPEDQANLNQLRDLSSNALNGMNRSRAADILESYGIPLPADAMSGVHPGVALRLLREHLQGQQ